MWYLVALIIVAVLAYIFWPEISALWAKEAASVDAPAPAQAPAADPAPAPAAAPTDKPAQ